MRRYGLAAGAVIGAGVVGLGMLGVAVFSPSPAADESVAGFSSGRLEIALDEVRRRAEAGDPAAQFLYGRRHELGDGVVQNAATALVWYERAAAQGWADAVAARARLAAQPHPERLTRVEAPPAAPTPAVVAPGDPLTGGDVAAVQRRLNELGYRAGPADGKLGARTRAAVRAYQEDARLPLTGALDRVVLSARAAPPSSDSPGEDGLAEAGRLVGSVREIQTALTRRGYWHGPRSGQLSPALRQAIAEYQADAGLPATGRLSETLLDHLRYARPEVMRQQAQAR